MQCAPNARLRRSRGSTRRIAAQRIAREHTRADEAHADRAHQPRQPLRTVETLQADAVRDEQPAARQEVGDLHPTALAQRKRAHRMATGAVAVARRTLYQVDQREQRPGQEPAPQQDTPHRHLNDCSVHDSATYVSRHTMRGTDITSTQTSADLRGRCGPSANSEPAGKERSVVRESASTPSRTM